MEIQDIGGWKRIPEGGVQSTVATLKEGWILNNAGSVKIWEDPETYGGGEDSDYAVTKDPIGQKPTELYFDDINEAKLQALEWVVELSKTD